MNDKKSNALISGIRAIVMYCEVFILVCLLPFLLKLFSLTFVMKFLTPSKMKGNVNREKVDLIVEATEKILGMGFLIFYPTCLKRSLVLYHFLRKAGINTVIYFAIRKKNDVLDGHCWITKNGKRIYDNLESVDDFTVTFSYPPE